MLLSMDDRSGIVYEINPNIPAAYPRFILMEGAGDTDKGMKCEWAAVKDGQLVVGSFGKEYTQHDGSIANTNNMWIITLDSDGKCVCGRTPRPPTPLPMPSLAPTLASTLTPSPHPHPPPASATTTGPSSTRLSAAPSGSTSPAT